MEETVTTCVFCYHSFPLKSKERGKYQDARGPTCDSFEPEDLAMEFIQRMTTKNKLSTETSLSSRGTNKSPKFWSWKLLKEYGLSACDACSSQIACIAAAEDKQIETEESVRKLQLDILKMMRELETYTQQFSLEMRELGRVIRNSDESLLDRLMRQPSFSFCKTDVFQLRQDFVNVVDNLHSYHEILRTRIQRRNAEENYALHGQDSLLLAEPQQNYRDEDFPYFNNPDEVIDSRSLEGFDHYYASCEDDEGRGDYCGDNYEPRLNKPKNSRTRKRKRPKSRQRAAGHYGKIYSTEEELDDDRHRHNTEGEVDHSLPKPVKKRRLPERSTWKERIIRRVDLRRRKSQQPGASSSNSNEYLLKYNEEMDCLFAGDIQVTFHEQDQLLECSKCRYTSRNPSKGSCRPIEVHMQTHILNRHVDIHHPSYKRGEFVCAICGRPMNSKQSLIAHKWTHMNEAERAAAQDQGVEDPRLRMNRQIYQCSTCGKQFGRRSTLKIHEEVHQEQRQATMCPKCGKTFKGKNSLYYHQRLFCALMNGEERSANTEVKCRFCGKAFKNSLFLNNHMKILHSENGKEPDRTVPCPLCPKLFKRKKDVDAHLQTHNQVRSFICRKGCGAGFTTYNVQQKHEGRCDGTGTPLRKRTVIVTTTSS